MASFAQSIKWSKFMEGIESFQIQRSAIALIYNVIYTKFSAKRGLLEGISRVMRMSAANMSSASCDVVENSRNIKFDNHPNPGDAGYVCTLIEFFGWLNLYMDLYCRISVKRLYMPGCVDKLPKRIFVQWYSASARQRPHWTGVVAGVDALQANSWNLWTRSRAAWETWYVPGNAWNRWQDAGRCTCPGQSWPAYVISCEKKAKQTTTA